MRDTLYMYLVCKMRYTAYMNSSIRKGFVVVLLWYMAFLLFIYFHSVCQKSLQESASNVQKKRPFRQVPAKCSLNKASAILNTSRTIPPAYPCNGTGQTVDISGQFRFDVFNSFCRTSGEALQAVLPVYSAPDYFERRMAIRETVGKECRHFRCKVFFIIGISLNRYVKEAVQQERNSERDILIIDKMDTYRDLNNKAVAMLDWLIAYCPQPKYVIHFIDDTYPNLHALLEQLETINNNKYIVGNINAGLYPIRSKTSRWYISEKEYPYPQFPDYISGVAYAFLNSDCKLLRGKVHVTEYSWVEDVWFTGYVAVTAGFTLTAFKKPCPSLVPTFEATMWQNYTCFHLVTPKDYYDIHQASTL